MKNQDVSDSNEHASRRPYNSLGRFAKERIDVIGCGSVGAKIAQHLARYGAKNLHLWDGDVVEEHNLDNQVFFPKDIGQTKVEALANMLFTETNLQATIHNEFLETPTMLGTVVFLAVDKMTAREQIFDECLHLKPATNLVVETRMGKNEFRIYGLNPNSRLETKAWKATLYPDRKIRPNACRERGNAGDSVSSATASFAAQRFWYWYKREIARDPKFILVPHFEQIVLLYPLRVITREVI
jgi:molybdopterin/thiamine biosynthesis adenylyltransferase